MNFFSCRLETPLPASDLVREETLMVDSRGEVFLITRMAVRCARGRHLVTSAAPCGACEREWWWSEGFVTDVDGWVHDALKVSNEERSVLLEQGWTVQKVTVHYTHMLPPADEEEVLLPLADPSEMPSEVRRGFMLAREPELPPVERRSITRLNRKDLMTYKRVAPTLSTLAEHLDYLSAQAQPKPKRRRTAAGDA